MQRVINSIFYFEIIPFKSITLYLMKAYGQLFAISNMIGTISNRPTDRKKKTVLNYGTQQERRIQFCN